MSLPRPFALCALALAISAIVVTSGCSSAKKRTTPELGEMRGKKVALVDLQGTPVSKSVVEVALVNQLVKTGDFVLLNKGDVEKARAHPDQDPLDLAGLARRAGAAYALKINVLDFEAETREGYSAVEEEDSQLEAETGNGKTKRLYKVKALDGQVRMSVDFTSTSDETDTRSAIAEYRDKVVVEGKDGGIHLPPKLRFLETLTNEALRRFFEQYR